MKKIVYASLVAACVMMAGTANANWGKKSLEKRNADIMEEYNEAVEEINKAEVSDSVKSDLKKFAMERRDMAQKYAKDCDAMMKKQKEYKMNLSKDVQDKVSDAYGEIKDIK